MRFWEVFWQIVLLAGVVGFAVLVVVVACGGVADIRAMLGSIDEQHASPPDRANSSGSPPKADRIRDD